MQKEGTKKKKKLILQGLLIVLIKNPYVPLQNVYICWCTGGGFSSISLIGGLVLKEFLGGKTKDYGF